MHKPPSLSYNRAWRFLSFLVYQTEPFFLRSRLCGVWFSRIDRIWIAHGFGWKVGWRSQFFGIARDYLVSYRTGGGFATPLYNLTVVEMGNVKMNREICDRATYHRTARVYSPVSLFGVGSIPIKISSIEVWPFQVIIAQS